MQDVSLGEEMNLSTDSTSQTASRKQIPNDPKAQLGTCDILSQVFSEPFGQCRSCKSYIHRSGSCISVAAI